MLSPLCFSRAASSSSRVAGLLTVHSDIGLIVGAGVAVGGADVAVAWGTGVAVAWGTGVAVAGTGVGVASSPQAATTSSTIIRMLANARKLRFLGKRGRIRFVPIFPSFW